ncbi:MAG: threonylcarbamoyl-AMP synthase [Euryarchaeota archaeon]|nr:threonylcarbamoyl-AMP synthase [Euryarchaeota archaeon]
MEIIEIGHERGWQKKAEAVIRSGGTLVYPTDTLYGLGCDATNPGAVRRVYETKKRDPARPLPIAVSDIPMLQRYTHLGPREEEFARRFLPGAVTLLLEARDLPPVLTAGSSKVAVRIPDMEVTLRLIKGAGVPIVTTSANISGMPPPITAREAVEQLEDVDLVLDAGPLERREPSTIVDPVEGVILRQGRVPKELIDEALREIYGRGIKETLP